MRGAERSLMEEKGKRRDMTHKEGKDRKTRDGGTSFLP